MGYAAIRVKCARAYQTRNDRELRLMGFNNLPEDTGLSVTLTRMIDRITNLERATKPIPVVIAPTLLNSWVNYGGVYAPAGYFDLLNGRTSLRGTVKLG